MFRPIVAIGCGAIVRHAHWPAYKLAGFTVTGAYDLDFQAARDLCTEFGVPKVFETLEEALAEDAVFDISVPAAALRDILSRVPEGSGVLVQKPLGENLDQASEISRIAKDRNLKLAVNFQLRFAPYMLAAREVIESGDLGDILEIDFKVNVNTPWAEWDFLEKAPRMEIVYHSIHYLDLIRSFLGEPKRVMSQTIKHPASPKLHSSRSVIALDYGDFQRAQVVTNHGHRFGPNHQESSCRIEGTKGCIWIQMGLNMNYPHGEPDRMEVWTDTNPTWTVVPLKGSWFPHAFIGTMASLQIWLEDDGAAAPTHLQDALSTMGLVEACYLSAGAN